MIRIRDFTFYYSEAEKPALADINLNIADGEFVLLTGPSGSGKSSLLRCLNGLIPHFYGGRLSGRVEVQGLDTVEHSTRELAGRVGMVFQDPENQMVATDVEREIAFGLENLGFPVALMSKRVEEALDAVGMLRLRRRTIYELSGGEKQKLAIASVLALHPEVLVLDEPTSELDPESAREVLEILEHLNDELDITIVLVEHRLDRVIQYVDRLVALDRGKVVVDVSPRNVLGESYDKLGEIGVGLPPLLRLASNLAARGYRVEETPLTVADGRGMLRRVFAQSPPHEPPPEETRGGGDRKLLEARGLWHTYSPGHFAIRDINLIIGEGEFVVLMGRNGSGKTTLLKHFNGLLRPSRGSVAVSGTDTREQTIAELAHYVGFVFQNPNDHLFADTVYEEIAFAATNLGFSQKETHIRVERALRYFDLEVYRNEYPRSLSGGEKERLALASVLVVEPAVLVLDEPTRGMDHKLKSQLLCFLREYASRGNSVVLVTHDVEIVAEYASRVVLMSEGEIIADGDKKEVLSAGLVFSPQVSRLLRPFTEYGFLSGVMTVTGLMRTLV